MKLCSQHLRSACGSALDSNVGPHHRVTVIFGTSLTEIIDYSVASRRLLLAIAWHNWTN